MLLPRSYKDHEKARGRYSRVYYSRAVHQRGISVAINAHALVVVRTLHFSSFLFLTVIRVVENAERTHNTQRPWPRRETETERAGASSVTMVTTSFTWKVISRCIAPENRDIDLWPAALLPAVTLVRSLSPLNGIRAKIIQVLSHVGAKSFRSLCLTLCNNNTSLCT